MTLYNHTRLYNHPHLCSMSETAGEQTDLADRTHEMSQTVARAIGALEENESTEELWAVAKQVWNFTDDCNEQDEDSKLSKEIATALQRQPLPPEEDVEKRAMDAASFALKGRAALHQLRAHQLVREASRGMPVPA